MNRSKSLRLAAVVGAAAVAIGSRMRGTVPALFWLGIIATLAAVGWILVMEPAVPRSKRPRAAVWAIVLLVLSIVATPFVFAAVNGASQMSALRVAGLAMLPLLAWGGVKVLRRN